MSKHLHSANSGKKMLAYGAANGIGPFTRKFPKHIPANSQAFGNLGNKKSAPSVTSTEGGKTEL